MSRQAEQYLIGAMLINPDCIEPICAIVHPNDFADQICRDLLFLIMATRAKSLSVDIISLSACRETLSGGQMTIAEAADIQRNSAGFSNFPTFAQAVKNAAQVRAYRNALQTAVAGIGDALDAQELIQATQQALTAISESSRPIDVVKAADVMPELIGDIQQRMDDGCKVKGLLTGYPDLDGIVKGMRGGHMVVIAGRPGTGKTTLAMNIAEHCGGAGVGSMVFSLEMQKLELVGRMLCSVGRVPLNAINSGQIADYGANITTGATKIKGLPVWISDRSNLGIGQIHAIASFQKRTNKIGLIVIDYIGLVKTAGTKHSNRTLELGEVSRQCKAMAKDLDVPVIVLAQLNREIDKTEREPRLSDLRDSGEIEQDADVVMFVTRTQEDGVTKVTVAKHRHAQPGECYLQHRGDLSRFDSMMTGYQAKQETKRGVGNF
jgi:replicative DNA helicase